LVGTAGAVGHFLLIQALEIERASALSPFGYSQLLWLTLPGFRATDPAKTKSRTARSSDRAVRPKRRLGERIAGRLQALSSSRGLPQSFGRKPESSVIPGSRLVPVQKADYCTVNFSSFNT
jgi:hypothetical protein